VSRPARWLFWSGLLWASLAACYQLLPSPDLWWLLADGRLISETGAIPRHDPFSWSAPGAPWHNDQWLSGLLAYVLYTFAGLSGLHLAKAGLLSATLLLLLDTGRRLQHRWAPLGLTVALAITLLAAEGRYFFDVRAYLFTYLGLAILWRWLQLQDPLDWRKVGALFAVWANLHAGVSSGLLLMGLEMVFSSGAQRRSLLPSLAAACLACCLNPSGIWLLLHPILLLGSPWGRYLNEWAPCWKRPALFSNHLIHLALWVLAWLIRGPRGGWDRHDKTLAGFALFSLTGWRHIPLFALLSLPRWCRQLDQARPAWLSWAAWVGLLGWARWTPLQVGDPIQSLEDEFFPKRACLFLQSRPLSSRLFHPYGLGGYLLWSFPRGEYQVCIDGRAVQVYPWKCKRDYLWAAMETPREFEDFCNQNQIRTVMLFADPARREASARLLANNPAWKIVYRDHLVVIAHQ
jgi:hypothetical protein